MMDNGDVMDVSEITHHLGIKLLELLLMTTAIATSNHGEPIVLNPDNPASEGYRNIARRILGETVPLMQIKVKKESFWKT